MLVYQRVTTSIYLPYTLVTQVVGVIPSNKKRLKKGHHRAPVDILPGDQPQIQRFIMVYHLPHFQNDSCSYTSDVT